MEDLDKFVKEIAIVIDQQLKKLREVDKLRAYFAKINRAEWSALISCRAQEEDLERNTITYEKSDLHDHQSRIIDFFDRLEELHEDSLRDNKNFVLVLGACLKVVEEARLIIESKYGKGGND